MFSARTLMLIHEGVEKLAVAQAAATRPVVITGFHANVFERLFRAFNNPNLLKEVGVLYLEEFRMPGVALKHFELAHQFAPTDYDIEQLQIAAALSVAREKADQSSHSGLNEAEPPKHKVDALLRKTSKLTHVIDTRKHLDESADEVGRQKEVQRKTESLKPQTNTAKTHYNTSLNRAEIYINQGDFPNASTVLDDARKAGAPFNVLQTYYAQLGLTAYDHNRMNEALAAFLQMRDLGPGAVEGWFNCGLVYQKMGQLEQALASYQEAARLAPENPKTWCNLSSVYIERGEAPEAEKTARKALALKPDYARAWDNLASALSAMNSLLEASDACQQAIRFQSGLHSAWFKLGVIHFQLENPVMAAEAFHVAAENPHFSSYVLYYDCMIAAREGDFENALHKLEEGRAADTANELETQTLKELALAFSKAGNHSSAADFYRQIVEKHPEDFSTWLLLGTAYHRAQKHERAREAYVQATELKPDNHVPWHNLGLLASDQGKHEDARANFQREVELAPKDAKAWYDLGVSLKALGRLDESLEAFGRAESLVGSLARSSSDLSAALSIVRRLNLSGRLLKTE
jgi:tetratricopeptide (TPR) repeat protein